MTAQDVTTLDRQSEIDDFVGNRAEFLWPGTRVVGYEAVPGDASSRAYLRYRFSGPAECPDQAIAMVMEDASIALSSDELGVFGDEGPRELPFANVQRFLAGRTDAVPNIFAISADSSLLLLEDLGDTALWDAATRAPDRAEALFAEALALIADLQSKAVDDGSGCYAFRQRFDERLFLWEFEHFIEFGVADAEAQCVSAARTELALAAATLAAMPTVFCHRDYHAWNIHVLDGRLRMIDFQDALLGPRLYDVASLLTDRITPELVDPAMEQRLIAGYLCARSGTAPAADELETALAEYRLMALQRALKVVGRFNYLAEIKGKTHYLTMIPAAAATADRMLSALAAMPATTRLLAEYGKTDG
jgi:aminoglycoside/choline kinase family phosphotransferase